MKQSFKFFGIFFVAVSIFVFSTCQIGLGGVVDTREPELAISYPPESAVIRDTFILSGTCDDDIGVTAVKVKITNSNTNKSYGPFDAQISEKTWSITLNKEGDYAGFEYADGRYSIDAWALDNSKRKSGVATRTYDIDNTAPVLYVSKPLSKGSDAVVSTFGKQVKITGEISEAHTTESITVHTREYNEATDSLAEECTDVSVAGTIDITPDTPLMFARYYTDGEAEGDENKTNLRNNYLKIYPDADSNPNPEDKLVYCTFELSDNARVYQNPGDSGSGTGNISTRYFINSTDFSNTLVSSNAHNLTVHNMRSFLNGTSTYSSSEKKKITELLEAHPEFYVDSGTLDLTASKFILNPDNNPTYRVEGYAIEGASRTSYTPGGNITIQLNSGKDSIILKTKSMSVFIESEETDSEGNPVFSKTYVCSEANAASAPEGVVTWTDAEDTSLTKTITAGNSDGLADGCSYKIYVTGEDRDGNPIYPENGDSKGYGFVVKTSAEAPTVRISETLKGKYYSAAQIKNEGIEIPVVVETKGVNFTDDARGYTIDNGIRIQADARNNNQSVSRSAMTDELTGLVTKNGAGSYPATLKLVKPLSYEKDGNNYSLVLKIGGDNSSVDFNSETGIFKYSFYVMALDCNNKTGSDIFTFFIDNQAPEFSEQTISIDNTTVKTVKKEGDAVNDWLNGTVYIKAKIHDNNEIKDVVYWIYAVDSSKETLVTGGTTGISLGAVEDASISVDTTDAKFSPIAKAADSYEYRQIKLVMIATDAVGNTTSYNTTFGNTYIDQETDKPVIEGSNFVFNFTEANLGKDPDDVSKNIFGASDSIIGTISDDDGLGEGTKVVIKKGSTTKSTTNITGTESFKIQLPEESGKYTVIVEAYDSTWATASEENKEYRTSLKSTVIAVDHSVPVLEETEVGTEDVQYVTDKTIKFLLNVSDDLGLPATDFLKVTATLNGAEVAALSQSITAKENDSYKYEFVAKNATEGSYTFEFVATDLAGKSTTVRRTICRDKTAPVFNTDSDKPRIVTEGNTANGKTWYGSQTIQIKGRVSDSASGVSLVQYSIDGGSTWKAFSGTTSFEEVISGLKNDVSIRIKAKDVAGNESGVITLGPIYIDNVKPTVEMTGYTVDSLSADTVTWKEVDGELVLNGKKAISLKGTASDPADDLNISGRSDVAKINIKCGSSDFTSPDLVVTSFTDSSVAGVKDWVATLTASVLDTAFKTAGSGKIWAQVVDNAGSSYEVPIVSVKYDSTYPEATITSVVYEGTETAVVSANKLIVINGSASDNQSLKSVKLQYQLKGASSWTDYAEVEDDLYSWSIEVDTEDAKFTDGSTYTFRAVAEDEAGNIGNSGESVVTGSAYKTTSSYKKDIAISQDSDRPVIKISNLEFGTSKTIQTMTSAVENHAHLYNTNRVYLNVTDDDGTPTVEYKLGNEWKYGSDSSAVSYYTLNAVPAANDSLYKDSGCLTLAKAEDGTLLKVGSYLEADESNPARIKIGTSNREYALTDVWTTVSGDSFVISEDGPHTVIFRVTDAKGSVFTSAAPVDSKESGPKLQSIDGKSPSSKDTRLFIDVDMAGPVDDGNTLFASAVGDVYREYKDDQSLEKFGGKYTKFKLSLNVKDPNGVKKVELSQESTVYEAVCEDANYTDGEYHTWVISDIDVSGIVTGRTQFVLKLEDNASNSNESYINIDIDNSPAYLGIESHSDNDLISTAFILKGYITDGDNETVIKYYTGSSSTIAAATSSVWDSAEEVIHDGGIFRLNVDGRTAASDGETHTVSHKQLFVNAYGASEKIKLNDEGLVVYSEAVGGHAAGEKYLTTKNLYFHFLVTDKTGNTSTNTLCLVIDPQGDIPTVEVTYPVYPKAGTVSDIDQFAGKVRVQGKATVKGSNRIVGVYMQIDPIVSSSSPSFGTAKWTGANLAAVQNKVLCPSGSKLSDSLASGAIENIYARYNATVSSEAQKSSTLYGIYVGNSASWNYTINTNNELEGSGTNTIGIRMYVVDSSGNINILKTESDVFITLDADAPQIGTDIPLYLYQYKWVKDGVAYYSKTATPASGEQLYTDSGCSTAATGKTWADSYVSDFVSEEYQTNMAIKGEWWLHGSATDSNGIKALMIYTGEDTVNGYNILTTNTKSSKKTLSIKDSEDDTKIIRSGYEFNYKVGSNASNEAGTLNYTIYAQESTEVGGTNESPITLRYDNMKPVLNKTDGNFNISAEVLNNYGFYTFGSSAYETGNQSGFDKVVVYFKRTTGTKIYDTYLSKSVTENALVYSGDSADVSYSDEDNLYWKEGTVDSISGAVVTLTADDKNIHNGGLVKLGGTYYIIKGYDSDSLELTLNGNPSTTLEGSSVYFAIGNVIDTVGSESTGTNTYDDPDEAGYGYYSDSLDNTDDYMIESTITSNGMTLWSASINSNNIPDGPIEIHYVVFDKAGNSVHDSVTAVVKNNNPRLSAVRVWCDFDGDGNENSDGSESETYYYQKKDRYEVLGTPMSVATAYTENLIVSGNNKDSANGGTSFMTVKNAVTFIPEIIGGNNELYYQYEWKSGSTVKGSGYSTTSFGNGNDDNIDEIADSDGYFKKDIYGDSYVKGSTTYKNSSDEDVEYQIPVTTANLATIGNSAKSGDTYTPVWFNYTIWDSTEGCNAWSGSTRTTGRHSASFKVALNVQYNDETNPTVAITPFSYTSKTENSLYKNSEANGHIELAGDLETAVTGKNVKTAKYTSDTAMGTDAKVSGKITIRGTAYDDIGLSTISVSFADHENIGSLTTAATFADGTWTSASADNATNMTNNGWTFEVVSNSSTQAGHSVEWECNVDTSFITNLAELNRTFTVTAKDARGNSGAGLTASTNITMDVVPYIRKLTTSLSSENNGVYARTALGHYSVYAGEAIKVVGFNFAKGNADKDYTVSTTDASGEISISVNGIPTLNNINNAVSYNLQPNGINNDNLDDNVYLDIWGIDNDAVRPYDNYALNMSMAINQQSGMVGFGFNNGTYRWSMANGTTNSYQLFYNDQSDFTRCSSFTVDAKGNTYGGVLLGNENAGYRFYSSRWGTSSYLEVGQNSYSGTQDKDRYQGISYASLVNSDNTTCLYMAYLDNIRGKIYLKSGVMQGTTLTANGYFANDKNSANAIEIADSTASSEYISVGVTQDNTVVVIWYDAKAGKLKYKYGQFTYVSTDKTVTVPSSWTTVDNLMSNGGKYCKIAIDNEDGVHIAAYDTFKNDLKYIYISDVNPSADDVVKKTATVDAYLTVGQNISLDVAQISKTVGDDTTTYQIPYIGYWATSPKRPRYAYLADPESFYGSTNINGVNGNKYTGVWECKIIPSASKIFIDENTPWLVNVGVWKDKTTLKNNNTGVLTTSPSTAFNFSSNVGKVYGNGTSNAILSYLVENPTNAAKNYGETAQLK